MDRFNIYRFFEIDYDLLPGDVKQCMPPEPGKVCMKLLLRDWDKNRFDLVRKPVGYPESFDGKRMRQLIREAKSSEYLEVLRHDVRVG